jgi:hypothetical protein
MYVCYYRRIAGVGKCHVGVRGGYRFRSEIQNLTYGTLEFRLIEKLFIVFTSNNTRFTGSSSSLFKASEYLLAKVTRISSQLHELIDNVSTHILYDVIIVAFYP